MSRSSNWYCLTQNKPTRAAERRRFHLCAADADFPGRRAAAAAAADPKPPAPPPIKWCRRRALIVGLHILKVEEVGPGLSWKSPERSKPSRMTNENDWMCRMDDLNDVMKNDNGATFRRPNWVVAVADWELCDRGDDDDKWNLAAGRRMMHKTVMMNGGWIYMVIGGNIIGMSLS